MSPRLTELNLNLLHSLDALLVERNVTRAARRVGISQPAMSQNLATLRSAFADELFVRTAKGMEPTVRALAIAPGLRRCLEELQRVINAGGEFDPRVATGTMRVATGDHLAAMLSAPLIDLLARQAPNVSLRLDGLNMATHHDDLRHARFDLVVGPDIPGPVGIRREPLFRDHFVCFVRQGHPIVTGARLGLRRYASLDHVLISPTGRGTSAVDAALESHGLRRTIVARVASFLLAPHIVASSDLVLTAPRAGLSALAKRLNLRTLRAPVELPTLPMAMQWDARRHDDPRLAWMREVLRKAVEGS